MIDRPLYPRAHLLFGLLDQRTTRPPVAQLRRILRSHPHPAPTPNHPPWADLGGQARQPLPRTPLQGATGTQRTAGQTRSSPPLRRPSQVGRLFRYRTVVARKNRAPSVYWSFVREVRFGGKRSATPLWDGAQKTLGRDARSPERHAQDIRQNANGVPSCSPGLRGTSYPGLGSNIINPESGCIILGVRWRAQRDTAL